MTKKFVLNIQLFGDVSSNSNTVESSTENKLDAGKTLDKPNSSKSNNKSEGKHNDQNRKGRAGKNFSRRNNGRKPSDNRGSSSKERVRSKESKPKTYSFKCNDVQWYLTNPMIVKPYLKVPFNTVVGRPFNLINRNSRFGPTTVLTMNYITNFGAALKGSASPSDQLNLVGLNLWAYMRSKNSRTSTNYDFQDLLMSLIAVQQLHMYLRYMRRVYGLLRKFSYVNRALPSALFASLGLSYSAIDIKQINSFYGALRQLEAKAFSFVGPKGWTFYERSNYLIDNVFSEDNVPTGQLILFRPLFVGKWNPDPQTGSRISFRFVGRENDGNPMTLNDLISIAQELLNAIINDSDIADMQSDILRAFSPEELYHADATPEDYETPFVFSPEILLQLRNAQLPHDVQTSSAFQVMTRSQARITEFNCEISQNPGKGTIQQVISYNPGSTSAGNNDVNGLVLNSITSEPTEDEVLEATRFCCGWHVNDTELKYNIAYGGSEIITGAYVTYADNDSSTGFSIMEISQYRSLGTPNVGLASFLQLTNRFPLYYVDDTNFVYAYQIDNYTVMSSSNLKSLQDAVLINMLALPALGSKNVPAN